MAVLVVEAGVPGENYGESIFKVFLSEISMGMYTGIYFSFW
jgi:hypothetical protein